MRLLDYAQTRALLQKYGIACAKGAYRTTIDGVMEESKTMPKPWVLKASGKNIFHKTEKSLIALDLYDFEHLYHAAQRLEGNARAAGLKEGEWGFLLQSKVKGVELIVGGKEDSVFGKTILFGSGGVAVELYKDFSTRVCPIGEGDAGDMIAETKASAYFTSEGFRGRKASRQKITELLLKTSRLLESEKGIESLDFNPVIADAQNAWVVDAKITVGK